MKKKAKELNDFLNNMVKEGKIKKNNFKELLSDIQNVGKEPIQVIGDNLNKVLSEIKETFAVRPSKIEYTRVDAIEQATIYFEPDITIDFDDGLELNTGTKDEIPITKSKLLCLELSCDNSPAPDSHYCFNHQTTSARKMG